MKAFSSLTALRLLLPLVFGIMLAGLFRAPMITAAVAVIIGGSILVAQRLAVTMTGRLRLQRWRFLAFTAIIVAIGMEIAWWNTPSSLPRTVTDAGTLAGRIDAVDFNTRSTVMRVRLFQALDTTGNSVDLSPYDATVRLSTRGCDYSLAEGDIIAWHGGLQPIIGTGNPYDIDYRTIMRHEGIIYEHHVGKESDWTVAGSDPTWRNRLAQLRARIENAVLATSLRQPVQEFVIALLLGNDRFIDRDTRHEFALAGVAHVLALSGLHVGVIGAVLYFLLFPLDFIRMRRLRLVLTLVAVITFDALTGFAPSVVRATVMMAMLMAPPLLHRRAVPLNSLAVAAVIILVVTPQALFSAGFQLSFITVGFIILFSDKIKEYAPRRKWLNVIFTTVATTLVATFSTTVLSAYYFNTLNFGTSLLANCLILPAFPLLMIVAVAVLALAAAGVDVAWLNRVFEAMYDTLLAIVEGVNNLGWHTSYGVHVSTATVILFYLMLAALATWLFTKRGRWLVIAATALLGISVHAAVDEWQRPRHGLVIFNDFSDTPILYFCDDKAWLWQPDRPGGTDVDDFINHHTGFMAYHRFKTVTAVDSVRHDVPAGVFDPPYAMLEGKRIAVVARGHWAHATAIRDTPHLDYLIVTGRYHGGIDKLRELYPDTRQYIIAGNVYVDDRPAIFRQLDSLKQEYRDLKSRGALVFSGN